MAPVLADLDDLLVGVEGAVHQQMMPASCFIEGDLHELAISSAERANLLRSGYQPRLPRRCPHASPVTFGAADVARMLAAADRLAPTSTSPLRPAVIRLAVVPLYTAGLRRGELLRLTLADVDPRHGILQIRASKFHKVADRAAVAGRSLGAEVVPQEAASATSV
ncbi:integrase [Bradyrhizobium japonicum]